MTIKNYTSSVPAERTISAIESRLAAIGATKIVKDYDKSVPCGLEFCFIDIRFRIPVDLKNAKRLLREIPAYRRKNEEWLGQQSIRTAWRIIHDWVAVQIAMVQLGQAQAQEVFLPYLYDGKSTFFQRLEQSGKMRMLGDGSNQKVMI